jgi:hypothetical protein
MAPKNLQLPQISGSSKVNQTISVTAGIWAGTPAPTLSYQWVACLTNNDDKKCSPIAGANKKTLVLTASFIGRYIKVIETGRNSQRENSVFSISTNQVSR